jgi:hypothetical protein
MSFDQLFPQIQGWVSGLPNVWPVSLLLGNYAIFGALHLVGLALLGGAVILLNLRFLGAGLNTEIGLPDLERSLRPWFWVGFAIVLGTGVIIGMLNAEKLYYSPAFFAKIVALIAAMVFSIGVTNAIARNEGRMSTGVLIAAGIAFLIWLASMQVFSFTIGVNPGTFHMVTAGYVILALFGARTRLIATLAYALIFGAIAVMYFVVGMNNYDQIYLTISVWAMIAASLILGALLIWELYGMRGDAPGNLTRLVALFSILSWVTVAAGGRWIGFS